MLRVCFSTEIREPVSFSAKLQEYPASTVRNGAALSAAKLRVKVRQYIRYNEKAGIETRAIWIKVETG